MKESDNSHLKAALFHVRRNPSFSWLLPDASLLCSFLLQFPPRRTWEWAGAARRRAQMKRQLEPVVLKSEREPDAPSQRGPDRRSVALEVR